MTPSGESGLEASEHLEMIETGIVRLPGRRFPGIVIQGDTLDSLVYQAERAEQSCQPGSDAADAVAWLREEVTAMRDAYAAVLKRHRWPLPFEDRVYAPSLK